MDEPEEQDSAEQIRARIDREREEESTPGRKPSPQPGSKTPDEIMQIMRETKPRWQNDGGGLRGDAQTVSNTTANLNFKTEIAFRRPQLEQDTAPPAATSTPPVDDSTQPVG